MKLDNNHKKPPETRGTRNSYEFDLFSQICFLYQEKHKINFIVIPFSIERLISEGVDHQDRQYQDVAYYRGEGYDLGFMPRLSHFDLIKRYVTHIRWMLSIPLDNMRVGRAYIIE